MFGFGTTSSEIVELLSSMSAAPGPSNLETALQSIGMIAFDESSGKRPGVPTITIIALTSLSDGDPSSGLEEIQNNSDEVKNNI